MVGDLLDGRLLPQDAVQLGTGFIYFAERFGDMGGEPDGLGLVVDGPADGLAYPLRRVGAEAVSHARVKPLRGRHQADGTLLDQIFHGDAAGKVVLGDGDDQAHVGLDQALFGHNVAVTCLAGQGLFLGRRQQFGPRQTVDV